MSLSSDFKTFCSKILLVNREEMETTAGEIAKKLNKHYYDLQVDITTHLYIVGSVGRNTAIKNSSDLDLLFDLPTSVYTLLFSPRIFLMKQSIKNQFLQSFKHDLT